MKFLPHGTTFTINSVLVGGLIGVSLPSGTRGSAETTDTDSAYDKGFIPGLRDGGEVSLTMRYDPADAGQDELETNYTTNGVTAVVECVITLPGAAGTWVFDGFVTNPPRGDFALTDDTAAEVTATIKVDGGVTAPV